MTQSKDDKFIQRISSKETWNKVIDFISFHDSKSDKAKEIKENVSGYFGCLPIVLGSIIIISTVALIFLMFWIIRE